MPDIYSVSLLAQRDVEHLFAAIAVAFPAYTVQTCGWLRSSTIIDPVIGKFWEKLRTSVTPADSDDQAASAVSQAVLEAGIGPELGQWMKDVYPGAQPDAFAKEISRRHYLSAVSSRMGKLNDAILRRDDQEVRHIVAEIGAHVPVSGFEIPNAEFAGELFEQALQITNRNVYTYVPNLDEALGGLERQTETIVASRPSMGKTALIWQIARNVAASGGGVLFFSLEMSRTSLWARAACPEAGVTWRDVRAGRISDIQRHNLIEKSRELVGLYGNELRIEDRPQTTDTVWQAVAASHPDLVVIDHLRLLKDKDASEVKRQGYITQALKELAKHHNCAVLIAAQLSRETERRGGQDKRPQLSDLRDSGEIEENADVILMLYRESYYNQAVMASTQDPTEVWVKKNRDGAQNGLINLIYDVKRQWFEPAPR